MCKALLLVAVALPLVAQNKPFISDGYNHGDPPFLIEQGWTPLLNGKDLSGWHGQDPKRPNDWLTTAGIMWEPYLGPKILRAVPGPVPGDRILNGRNGVTVNLVTDEKFGDIELYLEFMIAKGSHSGVYRQGLYEIQIFDSFGSQEAMNTSDGGAVYHRWIENEGVDGTPPMKNASRGPGEWQSYQIWFRAPRFDASGKKTENAKFLRVLHNGQVIQKEVDLAGPTRAHMDLPEAATGPIMLQGDHGPVVFRNIYWRPLRPIIKR